ncbi:MAG: hypothetical protein GY904_21825 [Planctomycetaceae bacterium]|nr:hypothetical protein [Planctomycetaceae bacterium]
MNSAPLEPPASCLLFPGAFLIGAFLIGAFLIGAFLIGAFLIGMLRTRVLLLGVARSCGHRIGYRDCRMDSLLPGSLAPHIVVAGNGFDGLWEIA